MAILDLAKLEWKLSGWRPLVWELSRARKYGPYIGPIKAHVPGSIQRALLEAGFIPDWNYGVNSRACEWVEHREWDITTTIPAEALPVGERVFLDAQGLDYSGWILVDWEIVGTFKGCLVGHVFELTKWLGDGKGHQLSIVFEEPPSERGQKGACSKTKYFKPRYNYSWDWCPRMVPSGVSDSLMIRTGASMAFDLHRVHTELGEDNRTGRVEVTLMYDGGMAPAVDRVSQVTVVLRDGARELGRKTVAPKLTGLEESRVRLRISLEPGAVEAWWPNGEGAAKTYTLEVAAAALGGRTVWAEERQVGFKRIEWRQCAGAPAGAEPWLCAVNGKPVFLQGVNWTPPKLSYYDATEADYRTLIEMYRDMGCNILRVWGGAGCERELFYDLCDRAGILVWQEFPLSSAGPESLPPEDEGALAALAKIIRTYIRRRSHHVSMLLWCGGNELHEGPAQNPEPPCGYSYKGIAMMRDVVSAEDPGRRFLPTSPSGPRFLGEAKDFGSGLLHDVHGPWSWDPKDLEGCRKFFTEDDSLFRSEVGYGAPNGAEMILKYHGDYLKLPSTNDFWRHQSGWWKAVEFDAFRERLPLEEALRAFVAKGQQDQANVLGIAAWHMKRRFPRCGGFIVWMGHDCLPCLANCSVIDFERNLKGGGAALQKVFRAAPGEGESP